MRSSRALIVIGAVLCAGVVFAQGPAIPFANARMRVDGNGYLIAAAAQITGSAGPLTNGANLRVKTDSNGYLLIALADAPAPADAEYWVGAADASLTAAHDLSALATALVVNTAGVPSAYAGATCTNQVVRVLSAVGAATCATITSAFVDSSIALTGTDLSQFAATTSAQLAGVISNETGTLLLVFSDSPAFTTQISTPSIVTASGALTVTPAAGSGINFALSTTGDFCVNTDDLCVDTSAGNVGIGTSSPGAKLDVDGARLNATSLTRDTSDGADTSFFEMTGGGGASVTRGAMMAFYGNEHATDGGYFYLNAGAIAGAPIIFRTHNGSGSVSEKMRIKDDGNVGIGTTDPKSKLHVEGVSGWIIADEQDTDPTTTELDANDAVAIYTKSNKLVFAYNNAGTITYVTLDLDGSDTTWTHGTTAP